SDGHWSQAEIDEWGGDGDGVVDVWLAARAGLGVVGLRGKLIGLAKDVQVRLGKMLPHLRQKLLDLRRQVLERARLTGLQPFHTLTTNLDSARSPVPRRPSGCQ